MREPTIYYKTTDFFDFITSIFFGNVVGKFKLRFEESKKTALENHKSTIEISPSRKAHISFELQNLQSIYLDLYDNYKDQELDFEQRSNVILERMVMLLQNADRFTERIPLYLASIKNLQKSLELDLLNTSILENKMQVEANNYNEIEVKNNDFQQSEIKLVNTNKIFRQSYIDEKNKKNLYWPIIIVTELAIRHNLMEKYESYENGIVENYKKILLSSGHDYSPNAVKAYQNAYRNFHNPSKLNGSLDNIYTRKKILSEIKQALNMVIPNSPIEKSLFELQETVINQKNNLWE